MEKVSDVLLIVVLLTAAITDIRKGKIYNILTVPAILTGIVIALFRHEALSSIEGAGIMLAVGLVLLMFGILGGGDAKLLIAVGALEGAAFVVPSLLYSALAGGVLAIVVLIYQRRTKTTLQKIAINAALKVTSKSPVLLAPDRNNRLPYGIAIAAGCLVALVQTWMKQSV